VTTTRLTRHALIVATANYNDLRLAQLRSPAADAEGLAEVLADPDRGDFDVQIGIDETHADLTRKIALFFRDRIPNDLLLLHLSCHGVKDENGELYLAAADTDLDLLSATGISATWLNERIDRSRSRRTVVLLDCCFSGSFPAGVRHRAGGAMDAHGQLQGRGRAIITASNSMEYAYEGEELTGEGQPSVFTEAVVEGLRTGRADLDMDHLISIDDLYHYVYDRVRERTPNQTPSIKSDLEGVLYLARSSYRAPVVAAKLDPELIARTEDRYAGIREGAVQELASLLSSSDPSVALAAREVLLLMTSDDSRRVVARAQTALEAAEDATQERAGDDTQAQAADDQPRPPAAPPPAPRPARQASSRRPIAIAAALAAIAVVVIVAIIALSGGGSSGGANGPSTTTAVNASDKIPAGNLLKNPSFEQNTDGWDTFQEGVPDEHAQLSREQAADAPDGHQVVRVSATGPKEFTIDDAGDTVHRSAAGQPYSASAWVKATDETDGQKACLVLRERNADGSKEYDDYSGLRLSTAAYRQVRVVHTARASGNRIDVYLDMPRSNGSAGDSIYADAISLTPGDRGSTVGPKCP
jgi:caspase domain-containing protein/carbohydrate binding protein with CBM4/9 domain